MDERSIIVEASDGDYGYRWCFRQCMVSDTVDFNLMRTDPVAFPLKFDVSSPVGQKPWLFQTNDRSRCSSPWWAPDRDHQGQGTESEQGATVDGDVAFNV